MRVLVACEFSGIVRDAFRKLGHDAWSCDIIPSRDNSPYHFQRDVVSILNNKEWDMLIAHPPCTYLCNSGVKHLYNGMSKEGGINTKRWKEMELATSFFKILLNANIEYIAVENPIMHGHAKKLGIPKQTQIIQPWQFGHGETKATCLWLKNLPPLMPIDIVNGRENRIHKMPPSKDRGMIRSITYQGIANAMASQWG